MVLSLCIETYVLYDCFPYLWINGNNKEWVWVQLFKKTGNLSFSCVKWGTWICTTTRFRNPIQHLPHKQNAAQSPGCTGSWSQVTAMIRYRRWKFMQESSKLTYETLVYDVVHNIPNSITKLTPAHVSAQEPRTLRSLPPPLNWKHKKITKAHRHEVNADLFQLSTTTVHPTCSDDETCGLEHGWLWPCPPMSMSRCCSVPNPPYNHIRPVVTDFRALAISLLQPVHMLSLQCVILLIMTDSGSSFSLSITVHTPVMRSGGFKIGLIRCVHSSWH